MTSRRDAAAATLLFAVVTIVWTWPLARGLARDVPADLGDPLLNSWILAWDATHLGRGWWNANIFHPHPLTLAYSEHLLPQALAIAPLYLATRNPILCYNVVFLSTFVLSGLGTFLLARELTGNRPAAIVAALAFAFAPYRVGSLPHLQVLSSEWMPFALYGFRRYFVSRSPRPLVGAAAAWTLQNLSCAYYLFFFTPLLALYVFWEIVTRRPTIDRRSLLSIGVACAAVAAATFPFLLPYAELRRLGFGPRPIADVQRFAADTYAYLTADPKLHVWGSIARGFDKPEGALFPGLTVTILVVVATMRARPLSIPFAAAAALMAAVLLGASVRLPLLKITSVSRLLLVFAALAIAALALSRGARSRLRTWAATPVAILITITILAIALSFGPDVQSRGRHVADGTLYTFAYRHVPGVDGLRVPARFGMIVALGLSALAAFAVRTPGAAAIVGSLIVVESFAAPIPVNQNDISYVQPHLVALPDRVAVDDFPDLYGFVARLPSSTVLAELPLGEPAFDVRYMFYSTRHWKPLVNGYSGGAPDEYARLTHALQDADRRPADAWAALAATGATHAVVHEGAYDSDRGRHVTDWLRANGATEVAAFGTNRVLVLK